MAKTSARHSLAPTAASKRSPRARSVAAKSPLKKITTGKSPGRPRKSPMKDSPAKGISAGQATAGRVIKKRGKRQQSVATKALKLKEAAKARKAAMDMKNGEDDEKDDDESDDGPAPVEMFNDELKTSALEWEAEEIIDSKAKNDGNDRHYLVKWAGYPESSNTWEPEINLRNAMALISNFDEKNPNKP